MGRSTRWIGHSNVLSLAPTQTDRSKFLAMRVERLAGWPKFSSTSMKVIDPGHQYDLNWLDGEQPAFLASGRLRFVKREGEKFPGNVGSYSGTTVQEVLRACCDRLRYVIKQGELLEQPEILLSKEALGHQRAAIQCLEFRAAKRHGRPANIISLDEAEYGLACKQCGHTGCEGKCH